MRNILRRFIHWILVGTLALTGCQRQSDPQKAEPMATNLPVELIRVAASQVGVMEDPLGSNRGKRVDEYNRSAGADLSSPWCAAFAHWCFAQIGKDSPGAYSPDWDHHRVTDPKPGDQALVYFPSLRRFAHTIACVESVSRREAVCIEGNSNNDGSREGIGVFRRVRALDSITVVRWLP